MRFPARAGRFPADRQVQAQQRPAPDPAGEKRPPGAGRALAGGFGPPAGQGSAGRCGRGDGPCHGSGAGGSDDVLPLPVRVGHRNACVSPALARRCHQDPCHPHRQRPAPDPAGGNRPPGAGRALAGGFGPPAGLGSAGRCGRGDGPCQDAQGARRRKRSPLCGQAAHAVRPFQHPSHSNLNCNTVRFLAWGQGWTGKGSI